MNDIKILGPNGQPLEASKMQSFESAGRGFGGELANWNPHRGTADQHILPAKDLADARASDMVRNHATAAGGVQVAIDNIVGDKFKLSAKPNYQMLGITLAEAREFAQQCESAWEDYAYDSRNYIDAERKRNFTMLIRAGIENHKRLGEVMASAEWFSRPGTPYKTAIKLVNPSRVSNPKGVASSNTLRAGVEMDKYGAAVAYHIRQTEYNGMFDLMGCQNGDWIRVPREMKHGRAQFIHVFEPFEDGQTRALTSFVSILGRLKMLDKYQGTKLQNAIINATFAAAIETDLDSKTAFEIIGEGPSGVGKIEDWLSMQEAYHNGAGITFNGAKVPHLMMGEKLHITAPGNADAGYSDYEASLLRHVATGLGVSYEQLSKDYSKVNYSSARVSILESWRYNRGQKAVIADIFANQIYGLWLEEAVSSGRVTLPRNIDKYEFWKNKSAWSRAEWIGAGLLQVDGLKAVKESVERIRSGMSTYEKECALQGDDYMEIFDQRVIEMEELKRRGLPMSVEGFEYNEDPLNADATITN